MIIYSGSKAEFMAEVLDDTIAHTIRDSIFEEMHRKTPDAEFHSWVNSLEYTYRVLNDEGVPQNSGVAIEYNPPQYGETRRLPYFGLRCQPFPKHGHNRTQAVGNTEKSRRARRPGGNLYGGGANRRVVHPSYQAWSYAEMIRDCNEYAQVADIRLWPCAYLHNYLRVEDDPLDDPIYQNYLDDAPAFTKGGVRKLREYIKRAVTDGDDSEILYEIDSGCIKPSKSLQDAIVGMLESNPEFNLIDDQKVVFERIMELSRKCEKDGEKRVLIAKGGSGTGKTVIAINLLALLTQEGVFAQYCSKNSAPRTVYASKLKGHRIKSSIDNMFKGSGAYVDAPKNAVGAVLADESHWLNGKSDLYGNRGINQTHGIIRSARLSVFFIDESQRVTLKDIGSVEEIKRWAAVDGAKVYEEELSSQFRCNGSDGYLCLVGQRSRHSSDGEL